MADLLFEELSQLMEAGELVSIIRDDINPNQFITGKIHSLNTDVILISYLTPMDSIMARLRLT